MILLQDRKQRWIPGWVIILFSGIFCLNHTYEIYGKNETCRLENILFVSTRPRISHTGYFPTDAVDVNGRKLCFSVHINKTQGCCNDKEFNCNFNISRSENYYFFTVSEEVLYVHDIVLMENPYDDFDCPPSKLYNKPGSLFNIHKCLDRGVKNIRLNRSFCGKHSSNGPGAVRGMNNVLSVENGKMHCGSNKPSEPLLSTAPLIQNITSLEVAQSITPTLSGGSTNCISIDYAQCGSYQPPGRVLCPDPTQENNDTSETQLEAAQNIIKNTTSLLEGMTNCNTVTIKTDQIRGTVSKLASRNNTDIIFCISATAISILENISVSKAGTPLWGKIPREAHEMAVRGNGSSVGLFLIPAAPLSDTGHSFLNDQVVGIEMGAEISNLSETVDIQFRNVDKKGKDASCRSWDGKGKEPVWIKDGCHTKEENDSITCQCSHLTFFGILLSPPPGNISSTDLTSLTYITSIGCGLSMFFLAVGIFMHCLLRKRKSSQATEILMNLFVATFTLNLSFLVNDKIAGTGSLGACVAIAALLHYTVLATLTWFFMEALHLYFTMWKLPSEIRHYMVKICITGWVTPAAVVIPLLAAGKYGFLVISADDGTSATMCWIPDAAVHQGINVCYYAIVFVFTFSIFIGAVRHICLLKPKQDKPQALRSNLLSVLGLLLLLGITWAFAFFSHGPLRTPSFYIFTILNSFQGFFLFIYYYSSSKAGGERSSSSSASNTTITSVNH